MSSSSSSIPTMSPEADDLDLMFERALGGGGASGSDIHRGDQLAIEALAQLVRTQPHLTRRLAERIAERLHASSSITVRRTIDTLAACMHTAGDPFRHEIGRFKFLNEIVRLLSPTRAVRPVDATIRQRLMDLMLVWTAQYPRSSTKIREAYDMLRKQGVPHEAPSDHAVVERVHAQRPAGKERSVFDAIPGELLRSKNPADIQTAKLLIEQALEREQRVETLRQQHRAEVREAKEAAVVLGDVLTEAEAREWGTEERELARELFERCRTLQIKVSAYAEINGGSGSSSGGGGGGAGGDISGGAQVGETSEAEEQRRTEMADLLQANDALQSAIQRYNAFAKQNTSTTMASTSLGSLSNTDILTAALGNVQLSDDVLTAMQPTTTPANHSNDLLGYDGALDDIFTKSQTNATNEEQQQTDVMLLLEKTSGSDEAAALLLAPTTLNAKLETTATTVLPKTGGGPTKPVSELDMFGLDAVITGLKNNLVNTSAAETDDADNKKPSSTIIMPSSSDYDNDANHAEETETTTQEEAQAIPKTPTPPILYTPLCDLHIDLATIQPSRLAPRVILDDAAGLKLVLHFARDRPRPDCSVCVLTVTNQAALPVRNLCVDASVSRPCKVRLLAPSGRELPACRPFKPPTEDVMLVLLVAGAPATDLATYDLMFLLSYNWGDDRDESKDSIGVKALPAMTVE